MSSLGLFHTRLNIQSPLLGAPTLILDLLVDTVRKKVSGVANITQTTHPISTFHAEVWGTYFELFISPQIGGTITLHLEGNPSGELSQIAATFNLHGILDLDWSNGNVGYKYYTDGRWNAVKNATAHLAPLLPPQSQTPRHPLPLYASAVQQAQQSGNLAQLKSVVSQGGQQIQQNSALSSALEQLKAEIARLEA
ncbi:DUF1842 domain-containing protein [Pseudomonas cichorii]|uniref:DUF1842 domain-containing protein n=1 Tax=Pseudomonas cichorii TaxID=36746 RepID=UPI0018E5D2B1|nr:DUF1842 domain-containing protein [Pseudomonas cichorii]MBI6853768.1 DUF1842 domain-containing protein [Pseudomonas cichorii]